MGILFRGFLVRKFLEWFFIVVMLICIVLILMFFFVRKMCMCFEFGVVWVLYSFIV